MINKTHCSRSITGFCPFKAISFIPCTRTFPLLKFLPIDFIRLCAGRLVCLSKTELLYGNYADPAAFG